MKELAVVSTALVLCTSAAAAAETPEEVIQDLYDLVTFDAGTTPDWDQARSMFIEDAVIVLRTGREETTVFSVEGWIDDFVTFIERANVEETGFSETIVRMKSVVFGDIAHIWVLYEADIPGDERDPRQGVDSFQLIQKDGRWLIASITNEIPTAERPVPKVLEE